MDAEARSLRLLAATFAAPLFGAALSALVLAAAIGCPGEWCDAGTILPTIGVGTFYGFVAGLPAMVLLGLPMHAWLYWSGWRAVQNYTGAGVIAGAVTGAVAMLLMPPGPDSWTSIGAFAAIGAGTGAVSASLFWLLRRPDRDPNPAKAAP